MNVSEENKGLGIGTVIFFSILTIWISVFIAMWVMQVKLNQQQDALNQHRVLVDNCLKGANFVDIADDNVTTFGSWFHQGDAITLEDLSGKVQFDETQLSKTNKTLNKAYNLINCVYQGI